MKIEVLNIRLETPMRRALERAASADERTTSSLIRKVLGDWLAENGPPQPARKFVRNGAASTTVARQKREGRNHAGRTRS